MIRVILAAAGALCARTAFAQDGTVTVPLSAVEAKLAASTAAPAVPGAYVMGAARWSGVADPDTLALTIDATLEVSLTGGWKQVPLVGADVVLLGVEVDGRPVAVGREGGFHTWPTDAVGTVTLRLRAIASPSAERGAVQYDFAVPRTAATHLDLVLPRPGLRPAVANAVRSSFSTLGSTTRVTADLAPTDRIALVGLRDLGGVESRPPKLYAETEHLVSVGEGRVELFSVVHYTILYAGARVFDVFVPEGFEVLSADAEGAFTYTLTPAPGGVLVHGETDDPIRNRYEVSLRLVRDLPEGATRVQLPYTSGVEREHGWVGVEVPGRVQLEQVEPDGVSEADVHVLPETLLRASVSPLLRAFRTHGPGALVLDATPLPEVEVSSERLDRVAATTVVSASGRAVTELAITLRNRLRPGLELALPDGAEVVRASLDGEPVVPSRAAGGEIVLPLRRSGPSEPFTVQLVFASDVGRPRAFGRTTLGLPALDLPTSAVTWEVRLPESWRWSGLRSDVASQRMVGTGHWLAQRMDPGNAPLAVQGLMAAPTEGGVVAAYERYWVPAGSEVRVWAWSMSPALWLASRVMALAALVGACAAAWPRVRAGLRAARSPALPAP